MLIILTCLKITFSLIRILMFLNSKLFGHFHFVRFLFFFFHPHSSFFKMINDNFGLLVMIERRDKVRKRGSVLNHINPGKNEAKIKWKKSCYPPNVPSARAAYWDLILLLNFTHFDVWSYLWCPCSTPAMLTPVSGSSSSVAASDKYAVFKQLSVDQPSEPTPPASGTFSASCRV